MALGALPELPLTSWEATKETLHLWAQIVGKVRMASSAPRNHWWHVTLYVDVRGLTTRRLHASNGVTFEISFDFVDHRLVVRTNTGIKAFHNACRHRGVRFANGHGNCERTGFVCPFHGWRWNMDGKNTFVYGRSKFSDHQLDQADLALPQCRVETWGGCAWINLDDDAPPLRAVWSPSPPRTMRGRWSRCARSGGCRACSPSTGSSPWRHLWRATTSWRHIRS